MCELREREGRGRGGRGGGGGDSAKMECIECSVKTFSQTLSKALDPHAH